MKRQHSAISASLFAALTLTFCFFPLISCKNDDDNSSSSIEYVGKLLVFYQPNGLGDSSYIANFCYGAHRAALEHNLMIYDFCPTDWEQAKTDIKEYVQPTADSDSEPVLSMRESLGDNAPKLLFTDTALSADFLSYGEKAEGVERTAPYADPTSGFAIEYYARFGQNPVLGETHFYDALLLSSCAAAICLKNEKTDADTFAFAMLQVFVANIFYARYIKVHKGFFHNRNHIVKIYRAIQTARNFSEVLSVPHFLCLGFGEENGA